jgi:dethiobiotin synthetase
MMKKAVFITGTGTDVGKTVITAGMVRSLRQKGYNACPVKPVQTGCRKKDDDRLVAPDLEYSLKTADLSLKEKIKDFLCPCRYVHACSPHLAARFTGVYPDIRTIKESIAKAFLSFDILFIEGAGGILVPLNKEETMLDLIKALGFPVLLVAGAGLGTINHTLLSLDKLKKEAVPVLGVVFTQKEPYADEYYQG